MIYYWFLIFLLMALFLFLKLKCMRILNLSISPLLLLPSFALTVAAVCTQKVCMLVLSIILSFRIPSSLFLLSISGNGNVLPALPTWMSHCLSCSLIVSRLPWPLYWFWRPWKTWTVLLLPSLGNSLFLILMFMTSLPPMSIFLDSLYLKSCRLMRCSLIYRVKKNMPLSSWILFPVKLLISCLLVGLLSQTIISIIFLSKKEKRSSLSSVMLIVIIWTIQKLTFPMRFLFLILSMSLNTWFPF